MNVPSGNATSMFFRLFARAPRTTISPRVAGRRAAGTSIAPLRRRGTGRSATRPARTSSCCGRPWNITWPPCSPAPGPEIDQIVGGANRLLVVLDDEHGVAEIAQLAERREQPAVVALVQADRRLVEHVQHAGQLRSDLRREPDALALAARQRRGAARRASDSRRRRRRRKRSRSRISRSTRPAISCSRSVSSSASKTRQRVRRSAGST